MSTQVVSCLPPGLRLTFDYGGRYVSTRSELLDLLGYFGDGPLVSQYVFARMVERGMLHVESQPAAGCCGSLVLTQACSRVDEWAGLHEDVRAWKLATVDEHLGVGR